MNRFIPRLLAVLAIAALGIYAWFGYAQYEAHARLADQLQQMSHVLADENTQANERANNFIERIEEKVIKNRNPPAERAILLSCQRFRKRTAILLDTLHAHRTKLLQLTDNSPTTSNLLHPDATDLVTQHWGNNTRAQQSLATQFAAYTNALPAIAADSQKIAPPVLAHLPVVAALARLAHTECDLLTREMQLLRHFERQVGAPVLPQRVVAVATAESNMVQPGSTYRARFYLVKQLVLPTGSLLMMCNNRRVMVNSNGVGQVQFRAATQPGPAVWTGRVRYKFNGRDSTFQIQVPYRVARP